MTDKEIKYIQDSKFSVDDYLAEFEAEQAAKNAAIKAELESESRKPSSRKRAVKAERDSSSERVCFVLDKDLVSRIKLQALQENVSYSYLVSRVLDKHIKSIDQIIKGIKG